MNEVTNTETAVEAVELNSTQKAEHLIKNSSIEDLVKAVSILFEDNKRDNETIEVLRNRNRTLNSELSNYRKSVETFLKDHIKDDEVDVDDLREFAEDLGIELTKTIRVKCTIKVEGEFTVPLDFDVNDVDDESEFFNIRIDADPSDNDIDVDSEQWDVDSIDAEEIK